MKTNFSREISDIIQEVYGGQVHIFQQAIPQSIRVAEASADGSSIFTFDPSSHV